MILILILKTYAFYAGLQASGYHNEQLGVLPDVTTHRCNKIHRVSFRNIPCPA